MLKNFVNKKKVQVFLLFVLLSSSVWFSGCTSSIFTPLQRAAMDGDVNKVKMLLDKGTDINEWKYGTPLMFAASSGRLEVVKLLVARGANINAQAEAGWTALGWAAMEGHKEIVDFLIASGADVDLALRGLQQMDKNGHGTSTKLESGYKMIQDRRGWAQLSAGKYEQALESFKQLLAQEPTADNFLGFSYAYYGLGKYSDSLQAARAALKANDRLPYGYASLGRSQLALGDNAAAVSSFEKAVELSARDASLILWLGRAYLQAGDFDRGIKTLEKSAELDPSAVAPLAELCYARLKAGQWDEAIQAADRALTATKLPEDKANILSARAIALREKGATDEALIDAQKSLEVSQENERARLAMAAVEIDRANYEQALKLLAGIKDSPLASIFEATAYAKLGRFQEVGDAFGEIGDITGSANMVVVKNYQKLQELIKPQAEENLKRAREFAAAGKTIEALNEYGRALKLADATKAKEIRLQVAPILKANSQLMEVPEEARKYSLRAEVLIQDKKPEEAVAEYQKAIKVAPFTPVLYFKTANLLGEMQQYRQAVDYMKAYLELYPDSPDLRQAKDQIYKWEFQLERLKK
ncbi:MAG: ankyrin repeat domain-containing protein [Candidatus Saccharicenans sp.]